MGEEGGGEENGEGRVAGGGEKIPICKILRRFSDSLARLVNHPKLLLKKCYWLNCPPPNKR